MRSAGGGPVAGATLSSPGCDAVTGADGRFEVECPRGNRTFAVHHPDHLDRVWAVEAEGWGAHDVGSVELARVPLGGGLWLPRDGAMVPLPDAAVVRRASADAQRWCVDATAGSPLEVAAGDVRLLDNHAVDWRAYALDADGCGYRLTRTPAGSWTWDAERVEPKPVETRGPGREWVELTLPRGDYLLAEWYDGFLVENPDGTWRGHWIRATDTAPRAPELVTPVPAASQEG